MSDAVPLPLIASTVTCEPLHPCNLLRAASAVGGHALRAFRATTLVVKRRSRRSHRPASSHAERDSAVSGHRSTAAASSTHTTAHRHRDADRSRGSGRRARSADDSLLSTHSTASAARKAERVSGTGSGIARRSHSSGEAEARVRHRSRSRSGEAAAAAARDHTSGAASSSSAAHKTRPGGTGSEPGSTSGSARGSPSLPPLRPPPPAPAAVSLGGLTASRLHSNNSSFNSVHAALPPMTGKPPLSGQRSGMTPRGRSGGDAEGPPPTSTRTRSSSGGGGGQSREARRHQPRSHERLSSRDSVDSVDDAAGGVEEAEAAARSSRRSHRSTASSARASRRGSEAAMESSLRVTPAPATRKSIRQHLAEWDVTPWAYAFTHFVRAFPAKVVHAYCALQRQLVVLPLLHFRDEGERAQELLGDCLPRPGEALEEVSQLYLTPSVGVHFVLLRELLGACGAYVSECLLMDNSLVIKLLRSRRTSRKTLGWLIRLGAHALVDPIFLSAVTPLLLIKLRDVEYGTDLAQRLCITGAGVVRGLVVSAAAVLLERVVMPTFSRLVNRAVVTICESAEYVLLRRYHRWPESSDEEEDEEDDENEDEDEEDVAMGGGGGGDASMMSAAAASESAEARRRRRHARRARRERRKRREAREKAEEVAMHRAILRAIVYRVAGTLTAQCLVEHPMMMLVELLRSRAMMHMTGLLRCYDPPVSTVAAPIAALVEEGPSTSTSTSSGSGSLWASFFPSAHGAEDGSVSPTPSSALVVTPLHDAEDVTVPPAVVFFRRVGMEVGHEARALLDTFTDAAGQTAAIAALLRQAQAEVEAGSRPTARESTELFVRCALSVAPLYEGIQVTVVDRLVTFYVEVWTRLTK